MLLPHSHIYIYIFSKIPYHYKWGLIFYSVGFHFYAFFSTIPMKYRIMIRHFPMHWISSIVIFIQFFHYIYLSYWPTFSLSLAFVQLLLHLSTSREFIEWRLSSDEPNENDKKKRQEHTENINGEIWKMWNGKWIVKCLAVFREKYGSCWIFGLVFQH